MDAQARGVRQRDGWNTVRLLVLCESWGLWCHGRTMLLRHPVHK